MNVCILKESLDIGGTERSAANISKVLSKDHNVFIALYDASNIKYSYSGQLIDFALPPKSTVFGKTLNTFLRNIKLRSVIKSHKIDVLYTFTGIGNRQTRYKYNTVKIISARDFGGMCEKCEEYKTALDNSSAMICNSEYTRNYYISKYPNDASKVFALHNYIDTSDILRQATEETEPLYDEFIKDHKSTIVSVGRFCKEKGFEYLIAAFAQERKNDPDLGLVLVGDGDYKQKYMNVIRQYCVWEHVYFTGFQKNPYKYMTKCTCFVLSSLSEGFPNVLAEAMALSLPVISVNCPSGPAEILRSDMDYDAVTDKYLECDFGIMTPRMADGDNSSAIDELAKAIRFLLSDKSKAEHYSSMSCVRVKAFSEEAAREKLNMILNELIKRRDIK